MSRALPTILNRLLHSIIVLLVLSLVIFAFMRAIPGDPIVTMMGGEGVTQDVIDQRRSELGLDRPYHIQYLTWLADVVRGDLGRSLRTNEPVLPELLSRLAATAELAVTATLIGAIRSEEHTSELQSLMRTSYAVFCLKKKN